LTGADPQGTKEAAVSAPDDDDRRTIADSGTQDEAESVAGGGPGSRGPALSTGGRQEPGGAVPPYEGRKEKAEPTQEGGTTRGGVRVGGATGPVADDDPKAPDPEDTPGGRTAAPADEQPAIDLSEGRPVDPGVDLTSHVAGVPKGERGGA
jgi:hypothetical protein